MSNKQMTDEQKEIVNSVLEYNVVVNAVAGSGKTTTILFMANAYPELQFLLITYNAKLRYETRHKCCEMGLENIEVHTYHSFCRKYYHNSCKTDTEIRETLNKNKPMLYDFQFDILILDEVQDMTPLFYELIVKVINDIPVDKKKPSMCLLGDVKQSIYEFNGSDSRFLSMGDKIFSCVNNKNWKHCTLSESFRITTTMADFINHGCFQSSVYISSSKKSEIKPRYIMCNAWQPNYYYNRIVNEVKQLLDGGYLPSDIFILAPSIRNNSHTCDDGDIQKIESKPGGFLNANKGLNPVIILENLLILNLNIPVYIPSSDEGSVDESVMSSKLVFLSFHQCKGLERKAVIVFNFDDSYFEFYERVKSPLLCPNVLYVATTRASEKLILIHDRKRKYLPFMGIEGIPCKFLDEYTCPSYHVNGVQKQKERTMNGSRVRNWGATEILRHLSQEVIDECYSLLTINTIREPEISKMNIPHIVKMDDTSEMVSDLNGICFPLFFQLVLTGESSIWNSLLNMRHNEGYSQLYQHIQEIDLYSIYRKGGEVSYSPTLETIEDLLYISNCWSAYQNKTIHRLQQIKEYNWLSFVHFEYSMERMNSLGISKDALFERDVSCVNNVILPHTLNGQIDILDKKQKKIYEIKCTKELSKEHFIQLALYIFMYETEYQIKNLRKNKNKKIKSSRKSGMTYLLYNINTNHLCEVIYNENIPKMYLYLIDAKQKQPCQRDDISFLKYCLENKMKC